MTARGTRPSPAGLTVWVVVFVTVLAWSAWRPHDVTIWVLEAAPALAAAAVLWATRRRFPLTPLAYALILVHAIILLVGAHYTYAEVPAGDWVRETFGQSRNNYDKLGHLAQGFVPALVAREVVIRFAVFRSAQWRNFFIACFCLAVAAFYELIEWWVALLSGETAEAFLSMQGYQWDTQADMWTALVGAIAALAILGRVHDRQLARLLPPVPPR